MLKRCSFVVTVIICSLLWGSAPQALATVVGFEGLDDSTPVTNQFAGDGVSFLNATVLKAGVTLNETEFPPLSGENVVFDDGGAISVWFAQPASQVAAFLTYTVAVTLTAFDALDNPVGSVSSSFAENFVSTGNPPNEMLAVAFAPGIHHITIWGSDIGASFVLDDLTFDLNSVPEPGSTLLVSIALCAAGWCARFRRARILPSNG